MFTEREPIVQLTQMSGARRGRRQHAAEAQFVEHDDDPCADHISIDPLDDRESRCAFRIRGH